MNNDVQIVGRETIAGCRFYCEISVKNGLKCEFYTSIFRPLFFRVGDLFKWLKKRVISERAH